MSASPQPKAAEGSSFPHRVEFLPRTADCYKFDDCTFITEEERAEWGNKATGWIRELFKPRRNSDSIEYLAPADVGADLVDGPDVRGKRLDRSDTWSRRWALAEGFAAIVKLIDDDDIIRNGLFRRELQAHRRELKRFQEAEDRNTLPGLPTATILEIYSWGKRCKMPYKDYVKMLRGEIYFPPRLRMRRFTRSGDFVYFLDGADPDPDPEPVVRGLQVPHLAQHACDPAELLRLFERSGSPTRVVPAKPRHESHAPATAPSNKKRGSIGKGEPPMPDRASKRRRTDERLEPNKTRITPASRNNSQTATASDRPRANEGSHALNQPIRRSLRIRLFGKANEGPRLFGVASTRDASQSP